MLIVHNILILNSRKFIDTAYGMLQRCGHLPESILCEIVLTKRLSVLTNSLSILVLSEAQAAVSF